MGESIRSESWLPVLGYEGLYEVSDLGRVRSHWGKSPRLLKPGVSKSGRRTVSLRPGTGTRRVYLLVLEAFVGPRPEGAEGCHNNGDPGDDRLANLRWDTASANRSDMVAHGRHNHATVTRCPRGHELFPPNIQPAMYERTGSRTCLACARATSNYHSALRRGLPAPDIQQLADAHYARLTQGATHA